LRLHLARLRLVVGDIIVDPDRLALDRARTLG
jgi:hypothetical protein